MCLISATLILNPFLCGGQLSQTHFVKLLVSLIKASSLMAVIKKIK
jgi:hypothetical protein